MNDMTEEMRAEAWAWAVQEAYDDLVGLLDNGRSFSDAVEELYNHHADEVADMAVTVHGGRY